MATMPTTEMEKRKEEEYEMQLFGFNSRAVNATLERIVEDKIQSCCKKLCKVLEKMDKPQENDSPSPQTNGKMLAKLYQSHSQPHANIMRRCVEKYITVPHNVLLDEDKCQEIQYTEEEFQSSKKHLEDLQFRAKKAKMLHAALAEELGQMEQFEPSEKAAEIVSSVIEDNTLHPDVDNNIVKCIQDYRVFHNSLKKLSTIQNIYKKNNVYIPVNPRDLSRKLSTIENYEESCNVSVSREDCYN